jgi:hypothetical protein
MSKPVSQPRIRTLNADWAAAADALGVGGARTSVGVGTVVAVAGNSVGVDIGVADASTVVEVGATVADGGTTVSVGSAVNVGGGVDSDDEPQADARTRNRVASKLFRRMFSVLE